MKKPCLAVLAAIVTLMGCRKASDDGILPDGMCAVEFHSQAELAIDPDLSKGTAPIGRGATVRVSAYLRAEAAADVQSDVFKDMKTYVAGAAGALSASPVNDNGEVVPGDAQGMELHNGTYDFYAYSPALKIEADNYTVKGIRHYMDFLGATVPGRVVSRSASDVELTFEHKCSKVRFNVKTAADMSNASLAADSVVLYKMAVSPAADYVLGGDIAATAGADADTAKLARIEAAEDNKSTSVWDILLPKSSGAFDGKFFLKVDGRRYVLSAKNIPAMSFSKATQYIFSAVVQQGSVSLVLNVASWDAVSGDVNAGGGSGTGSDSWGDGSGESGGDAGENHGIEIGRWDNVDWSGGMGGNPDPVTGAIEVGSWVPAQVIVDAGGTHVADVDSWVRKTLAAPAGGNHGGGVDGWDENGFESGMGTVGVVLAKANCGMVPAGYDVCFDMQDRMDKAAATGLNLGWTQDGDYTPLLIWQDVSGLVSGLIYDKARGYLVVSTDPAKGVSGGNAVVGLFPAGTTDPSGGTCIWSWHVWVTDYQPDGTKEYGLTANQKANVDGGEVHTYGTKYLNVVKAVVPTKTSRVIMDRNLGATGAVYKLVSTNAECYPTYGLFYQWGRKDPFPKAPEGKVLDDIADAQPTYNAFGVETKYPTLALGPVALTQAVKNPQVFYYHNSGVYDWLSPQSDALWGDGTAKSIFDPCPEGWRITPIGTWDDFGMEWKGAFAKNEEWATQDANLAGGLYAAEAVKAFYPAPGLRRQVSGKLHNIGTNGYVWSSAANGSNASLLNFNYSTVYLSNASNRAYGFQVRCIQE